MHSSPSNMMASATHDLDAHPCTLADDQHSPHLSELVNTPRPPLTSVANALLNFNGTAYSNQGPCVNNSIMHMQTHFAHRCKTAMRSVFCALSHVRKNSVGLPCALANTPRAFSAAVRCCFRWMSPMVVNDTPRECVGARSSAGRFVFPFRFFRCVVARVLSLPRRVTPCLALAAASHHCPSVRESAYRSACLRSPWLVQQSLHSWRLWALSCESTLSLTR